MEENFVEITFHCVELSVKFINFFKPSKFLVATLFTKNRHYTVHFDSFLQNEKSVGALYIESH